MDSEGAKTCARMVLEEQGKPLEKRVIYVMGIWFSDHFSLSVSDGLHSWTCLVSKEVIVNRASQWDVSVQEYIKDANFYLSHQQPGSIYSFTSVGESQMRVIILVFVHLILSFMDDLYLDSFLES
ncbi:hypothetical protein O6H91_Y064500 [Diphasiastrum complanatum]|nr:hypothetical protein O6H91_Y064500 [Diphasiastrum complanatum]KAJ7297325.1 hypothetical protein O6H91_Y064500 [Diphasiastrum complanatum]